MERLAWKAVIKEGMRDTYLKLHANLPEAMKSELKAAGIVNYSIWICGNEVFGYYECTKGKQFACEYQKNSPVVQKWEENMHSVTDMQLDPETGAQPELNQIFYLD